MRKRLYVEDEMRPLLPHMSPATTLRLLAEERHTHRLHGIYHIRSTTLGSMIPVQTRMGPPLLVPRVLRGLGGS